MSASKNVNNVGVPSESSSSSSESYGGRYDQLEWIKTNEMMYASGGGRGGGIRERIIQKTKENPFVPFGTLATVAALAAGLWSMKTGDSRKSQLMMRARIIAQGLTVVSIVVGMYVAGMKKKSVPSVEGNS